MELTWDSIPGWLNEENVHIHNRILLFSLKKEGNLVICNEYGWTYRPFDYIGWACHKEK